MTSIRDKAQESAGPTIVLTADLEEADAAQVAAEELYDCDDLTPKGEFPEFGEFLEMRTADGETVWWECSKALADLIVGAVEESEDVDALIGTSVDVDWVAKAPSGEWRFTLEIEPTDELIDSDE